MISATHIIPVLHCRSSWWDYFLPVTLYEWLWTGKYGHQHCLGLIMLYTIAWAGPLTLGFFIWESFLIYSGLTPHEINKSKRHTFLTRSKCAVHFLHLMVSGTFTLFRIY